MRKEFKVEGIDTLNPNNFGGMCSREAVIQRAAEKDLDEGIETIATTDAPVMVMDWEHWRVVREVLPMRYMEPPTNDKVPLLDTHTRNSIEKVKGSASNFRTEEGKLIAKTYISKVETAIREKVKEGHIDSVSIGYATDSAYTVEIPKGAKVRVDGVEYNNPYEDGVPMVVRTWWKVNELSLVPIGADDSAKFRSADNTALIEKINSLETEIKELKRTAEAPVIVSNLTWHEATAIIKSKS